MVMIMAVQRVIIRLNPYTMSMRWQQPSSADPDPSAAVPVPISVRPDISWPRSDADRTRNNLRRRRSHAHVNADIDARKRRGRREGTSNHQSGCGKDFVHFHVLPCPTKGKSSSKLKCLNAMSLGCVRPWKILLSHDLMPFRSPPSGAGRPDRFAPGRLSFVRPVGLDWWFRVCFFLLQRGARAASTGFAERACV